MKALNYWYLLAGCCTIVSCHNADQTKTVTAAPSPKPTLQQPFRYHKLIEVAPGVDYDIFSWGRGPAETGAYLILHSDSTGKQYTTTTGDLDGKLVDAFNTDMDTDGNPEIFIQSETADSTHYDKIDAYEFNDNSTHKLDFPKLTSSQKKGYHGGDDFAVRDNKLVRTFMIYDGSNAAAKPTGQKRTLEYSFHSNSFSVKQIETDTAATAPATQAATAPAEKPQPAPQPKQEAPEQHTSSKSERHHKRHESHHESRHEEHRHRHETASRHRSERHREVSNSRRRRHHRA